jgi:importin subunit alpha-1
LLAFTHATLYSTARLKSFKNGIDQEEGRRRREETHLNIRKQKKNEQLSKRRFETRNDSSEGEPALNPEGIKKNPTVEDLPRLIATIRSTSGPAEPLVEATRSIRKMLSVTCNPPVKEVVDAGALPYLVELLMRTDSHSLQFEAAWALTNVASTNFTSSVADQENAVQYLINLLRSPSAEVREQSAWCLGNIAGDGPAYRDMLLDRGALAPL